jgi:hypothetical protein
MGRGISGSRAALRAMCRRLALQTLCHARHQDGLYEFPCIFASTKEEEGHRADGSGGKARQLTNSVSRPVTVSVKQ